jgi:hypothetical protein
VKKDAITGLSRPGYVPLCVPDITARFLYKTRSMNFACTEF